MKPYTVSIDKIKVILNTAGDYMPDQSFESRCRPQLIKTHDPKEEFSTGKMLSYYANYTFIKRGQKEGAIFIGLRKNDYTEVREGWKEIGLEWNPNKAELPAALLEWLSYERCKFMGVRSCDVALDFEGILPSEIRYFTRRRTGTFDSTIYIDHGSPHGEIKIYDKTKERKRMGEKIPQTTRVEIRIRNPHFFEGSTLYEKDIFYLQDICTRLGELYIPTDFHTLTYGVERQYGKFDPATVYMLRLLNPEQQRQALRLMGKEKATKYRALLKTADVDRLELDEYALGSLLSDMLLRITQPLREPPEKLESWYDQTKKTDERRKTNNDYSDAYNRILEKLRQYTLETDDI